MTRISSSDSFVPASLRGPARVRVAGPAGRPEIRPLGLRRAEVEKAWQTMADAYPMPETKQEQRQLREYDRFKANELADLPDSE